MDEIRLVDVIDLATFGRIPPCTDPSFDHRTCDYWEDATAGSKAARPSWLPQPDHASPESGAAGSLPTSPGRTAFNPFVDEALTARPSFNPFGPAAGDELADNPFAPPLDNPFAPAPRRRPGADAGAPRKLALLQRGRGLFGSYAKVLLLGDEPAAYVQFGPLSAYPRALALRDLYPQLPASPPPAVITCIATTPAARARGLARALIAAVCADLAARGFAAVEAYPERNVRRDATSAGTVELWLACGFTLAVDDDRFPVVRLALA
jgi:GNAT superfamily N-acetyltransferase